MFTPYIADSVNADDLILFNLRNHLIQLQTKINDLGGLDRCILEDEHGLPDEGSIDFLNAYADLAAIYVGLRGE